MISSNAKQNSPEDLVGISLCFLLQPKEIFGIFLSFHGHNIVIAKVDYLA